MLILSMLALTVFVILLIIPTKLFLPSPDAEFTKNYGGRDCSELDAQVKGLVKRKTMEKRIQTVDEINEIITPETGWKVLEAEAPHDGSKFLRLYRDEDVFITALPRDMSAGMIAAMGAVAQHYRIQREFNGKCLMYHIKSVNGYWLPNTYGYTDDISLAGKFSFQQMADLCLNLDGCSLYFAERG